MTDGNHTPFTKKCTKCKQHLASDNFHKNITTEDGLQHVCKACAKESRKRPDPDSVMRTRAIREMARTEGVKLCSKCGKTKPMISEHWAASARGLGGFSSKCKACHREEQWAKKCPAHVARAEKAGRLKMDGKKRCPSCDTVKSFDQFIPRKSGGVYSYCRDCCREQSNAKRLADLKADRQKKLRSYYKRMQESGDAMRAIKNARRNARRKDDPVYAMECRVRGLIGSIMRRAGYTKRSRAHEILGCDWEFFKAHIERQFVKGMTWDNRSEWHIDHIVPLASAIDEQDVLKLNHFTNLRPMWAFENLAKGSQITTLI